jgi:general secretion pathway protein L
MWFDPLRLGVVLVGNRLAVAAVRGYGVETFEVNSDAPATALRAELDARKLAPRTVALGLSRAMVSVKPIELPAVAGEVRDMVKFELERHLPFSADDAPFDFVSLPSAGEAERADGGQRVLVAAADRHLVESATRLAQDAKLRPVSVTVAPHDLVALIAPDRRKRVVWVHRAGEAIDLLFLAAGKIVLSRNIPGGDDVSVAEEIRRSVALTSWRACDAIWVSGDVGAVDRAAMALSSLGAPVMAPPYTPRARRRLASIAQDPAGVFELAVAVASRRRGRPLDLIPAALRPRRITRGQALTAATAAATVLLAIGALVAPGYRENRRLAALNVAIARLDPDVRAVEQVLRELDRKQKLLATIDSLASSAIRPLPVLRELTDVVPNDAWLTTLTFDVKGVELTGQAATASTLIPLLENSPRLERAEFSSPVTRGRDREQFRIRAAWEAGGSSAPATPSPASSAPSRAGQPPAASRPAAPEDGSTGAAPPAEPPGQPRRPLPPGSGGGASPGGARQ